MHGYNVPELLQALADDRGFVVDGFDYFEQHGEERRFWVLFDLSDHSFRMNPGWRMADEVAEYIHEETD